MGKMGEKGQIDGPVAQISAKSGAGRPSVSRNFPIGDDTGVGRANDQFVVSNISMTKPSHWIVKSARSTAGYLKIMQVPESRIVLPGLAIDSANLPVKRLICIV